MLNDKDYDELIQPIIDIYNEIEMELLLDVARRFDTYDEIGGSLEWYLRKLNDLGALNSNAVKIIAKYSNRSEQAIRDMLEKAHIGNFDMNTLNEAFDKKFIKIDPEKLLETKVLKDTLELSYKELNKTFRMIQTKAIESQQKVYVDILNKAHLEVSSGVYSYQQSISNAMKNMAKQGITAATYKRKDGKVVKYSIEAAVRRDTLTASHQLSNKSMYNAMIEMGVDYVDISKHIGARVSHIDKISNHAGWQGKQYKIHGSDNKYKNLFTETGFGLITGLGGVNCRHRMFAFFPSISKPISETFNEEENEEYYHLTQKQRVLERNVRKWKKEELTLKEIGDVENYAKAKKKRIKAQSKLSEFCKENDMKRDYLRERIANGKMDN